MKVVSFFSLFLVAAVADEFFDDDFGDDGFCGCIVCSNISFLSPGEFVTDLSDSFTTISVSVKGDGAKTDMGARVYDTTEANVDGLDPDLMVNLGSALIVQQADSEEPNDNRDGGVFTFTFDPPVNIWSLTLIDTKARVVLKNGGKFGIVEQKLTTRDIGDNEFSDTFFPDNESDYMRIKFPASGAISEICYEIICRF